MTETTPTETQLPSRPETGMTRRPRIRRLHWHLGVWTLVLILFTLVFLVLASMSLTGRVIALPDWVAVKVLERMNAAVDRGSFSLRQVQFGVTPRGRPQLRLIDVGIKDATGLDLAQLNRVEGGFRLIPALRGEMQPTVVNLRGAQMTLRRFSDGSLALSLGQESGMTGDLATVLDAIDQVFIDGLLAGSERVEASNLTITLEDARSGRLWQVTDGRMIVTQTDKLVEMVVNFDVFNQTEELASTEFSIRSAKAGSEASISARFENAAAPDIAAQSPALAFLSVIDAPIAGALRTAISDEGDISELVGTLEIGEGALSPGAGAQPAVFDGAKVYIDYDPASQRIDFLGASVASEVGTADAQGHVYLSDFRGGWPGSMIGQVELNQARLNPPGMFAAPLVIERGMADVRLRLDPFRIDIGQAVAFRGDSKFETSGTVEATGEGWRIALDSEVDHASRADVLALWPLEESPYTRSWVAENVLAGEVFDARIAWRKEPTEEIAMNGVYTVRDAVVRPLESLPDVEIELGYLVQEPRGMTAVVEAGTMQAPDGRVMDVSGSSFLSLVETGDSGYDVLNLEMAGPIRGALSILALEPFTIFEGTDYGPDVARGRARIGGRVTFPWNQDSLDEIDPGYAITGELTDVRSDMLIPDKLILADRLELVASNEAIEITGPVSIGQAEASGTWTLPLAESDGAGSIAGTVAINPRSLAEFGIGLSDGMITGEGRGQFEIDFSDSDPRLTLRSDLAGLALAVPELGWSKSPPRTGSLEVEATLGERTVVEALKLSAPGLDASGRITTAEGGGIGEARFERVRVGNWLNAPIVLEGRGDAPFAIRMTGGTIDLREADFGGGGGGGAPGPRQPLIIQGLDRMIVSEGIQLLGVNADLDLSDGMRGTFTGQVEGGAALRGSVAPTAEGLAFRILSADAGGVLRGAGVFDTARGGNLELVLAPVAGEGTYEGEFTITDTRIVEAPTMATLLSAVSVVGLLDQLSGEGIGFSTVDGRFRLTPEAVTLYRASAVGVSMGISLDGYYDLVNERIDMQGVLSPFYFVNALGRLFSPRDGEGLIGFNFTLKGPYDGPDVTLNPLSILTPGAFREIFRRPPPKVPEE